MLAIIGSDLMPFFRFIAISILLISPIVSAEEQQDILKIFQHFTLASAASGKCIQPSKEELTSFLANYQMVTTFALKEVRERKPELTSKQAQMFLHSGAEKATDAVYEVIASEGCDSPKIKDLIAHFHVQSKWKP